MSTVKEDLQAVAKTLSALSKDLNKIARKAITPVAAQPTPAAKVTPKKSAPKKKIEKKVKAAEPAVAVADSTSTATVLDQVFEVVRRSRTGASIAKLKEKTGLDARQLSNALYKLSKRGKIESLSRGHYVKKKV